MERQKGFTLIELIIVIVILGILAVTVAPKFLDVQKDAKISTLNGAKGAIKSAIQLVYAKSSIEGENATPYSRGCSLSGKCVVNVGGADVVTSFGFPFTNATAANLAAIMDIADFEITFKAPIRNVQPNIVGFTVITPKEVTAVTSSLSNAKSGSTLCQIVYENAANETEAPVITVATDGC